MNTKTYKLVPLSFFAEDGGVGKMETHKKEEEEGDSGGRSISDIVEANLQNTNFKPSSHYTADFKFGSKKRKKRHRMGGEGRVSDVPIFLPNTNVLPEYSEARKLKSLDQNLKDLLADTTMPEDFKIKLYLVLKQKYDNVRENMSDEKKSDTDNMEFSDENLSPLQILQTVTKDFPKSKKAQAQKLGDIFMRQGKFIRWDNEGNIIHPKLPIGAPFSLNNLIRSIVYKQNISDAHTKLAARIIRPFFDLLEAENVIGNDRLFNRTPSTMSKYVPW